MDKQQPAFPLIATDGFPSQGGMTLRDYFAAKAMQALLSDPNVVMDNKKVAEWSYNMADAMMEARNG